MSRTNDKVSNFPLVFAVSTVVVFAVGVACAAEDDRPKPIVASAPPAQPAISGDVVPSFVTQPATLADGELAYRKRNYREATELFTSYLQSHSENAYGNYMLGLSAWKSGNLDLARDAFEHSLTIDSTNVKALLNLSRVLLDQGLPDKAFDRIETALALDSGSAEVNRMMARVQALRGEREEAMTWYRVALSIDPADSWSMNNLGLLLIEQGRYEDALPPLARAVELRPESPAFANNLGVALERTGYLPEAADAFRSALVADSTYAKAARSLARVEGTMTDSTKTIDVSTLAAAFNEEIQAARKTRIAAVVKPDGER